MKKNDFSKNPKSSISQSESIEEVKELTTDNKKPEFVIIMGAVCVGKTVFRKEKYSNGYTNIDAGEIFIQLSEGKYYNFPSHLEDKMNQIGLNKMRESLNNRDNIVIEIIGAKYKLLKKVVDFAEKLNYSTVVQFLECDIDEAWERNINRDDNNVSAHFYEKFHAAWLKQAATEYLNKKRLK